MQISQCFIHLHLQAAQNSENCVQLLKLVQLCDVQLAKLAATDAVTKTPDTQECVKSLLVSVLEAAEFVSLYTQRGIVMRLVCINYDAGRFEDLEKSIRSAVQVCAHLKP
jgi:hypothetical protein